MQIKGRQSNACIGDRIVYGFVSYPHKCYNLLRTVRQSSHEHDLVGYNLVSRVPSTQLHIGGGGL